MATTRERKLRARAYEREPTTLCVRVLEYAPGERRRRAARIALPLFAVALLSLLIPLLHLVAVPGFLIASVVLGLRRLREESSVESIEGPCPGCGVDQSFDPPARFGLPATMRCPGCSEFVKLSED